MHKQPAEATFLMNMGKIKNLSLLKSHMDHTDKGDSMVHSHSNSHFLDLTILNSCIIVILQ